MGIHLTRRLRSGLFRFLLCLPLLLGFAAGAEAQQAKTVSISAPANANEGNSGRTNKHFTVSLSSTVSTEFLIDICITGGTATKSATASWVTGADYRFLTGLNPSSASCDIISIGGGGGSSNSVVGIQVRGDTDAESDETVIATITLRGNPHAGVTLGNATATYTILDDDTPSDTTAPQITSITRQTPSTSPTNADTLKWQVTFDEAVQNVDATDFSVDGTTATLTVSRVGSTHAYDITATGGNLADRNTIVTLGFANGHNIQDTSGNALTDTSPTGGGANDNTYEVDNLKPRVRSFTRQNPTTESTSADTLTWRVTFNEAVKNVNGADFIIYGTTATITSVTPVTGNEQTTYDLTVTGGNLAGLNGTVRLGFNTGGHNIHDIAGNKLTNYGRTSTSHNTFEVSNTAPNTAPTVANLIPNQTATVGGAFSYAVPADTFNDADGDSLTYSATQSDNSALPSWLSFIAGTRTFSGTPQSTDTGTVSVKVTANDGNSGTVSDTFDIVVSAAPTPTVTVTGLTSVTEGNDAIFTLAFSPQLTTNLTVNFTSSASGDFFSANSLTVASLIVPSGNSSWRFRTTVLDDSLDEPDGSITVTVNTGTGYTPGNPSSATIIVKDDDPTVVSLARVDSGALNEGDTAEFTVTLGRALVAGEMIDVPLIISGTNVTTADWSLATKTGASNTGITLQNINTATPKVRFAGLDAQIATLELTATADSTTESTETFTLALGTNTAFDANALGTNVGGGADPHSTNNNFNVTVNNVVPPVNAPTVDFDSATSSALEDAGTHTVTVNLSSATPAGGLTLSYNVTGTATAGSGNDFTIQNSGTVAVAAGATMATIPVVINDDSTDENAETVILTLTGGTGYRLGSTDVHTLTITDNHDPPPMTPVASFATASSSAAEDDGTHNVTVNLTQAAPSSGLTLAYSVTGTATAGSGNDFTIQNSGTVAVGAVGTTATIPVAIHDDSTDENAETVILTLTGGTGYRLGSTDVHTLTITDNDDPPPMTPVASFATASSSAAEDDGTHNVTVNLTQAAPSSGLTLAYSVTGTATAGSGNDFTIQNSGTVAVGAGATMATIPVVIHDDSTDENAETVILTLTGGTGYTLGSTRVHTLTITDNDNPPPGTPELVISKNTLSVTEGGTGSYTVRLAAEPTGTVTVAITSDNGDVTVSPASLTFHASGGSKSWNTAQTVTVSVGQDADADEDSVTLIHTASGGGYDNVTTASVPVTVGDDEATPTTPPTTPTPPPTAPTAPTPVVSISAGVPSVTEGDAISFTLSATPPPEAGATITVNINVAEGGSVAASGQTGGRQVAISSTSGMASFTVYTDDDTIYEPDGSITATVQAGAGYRPHNSNAAAAVSVKDNDPGLELSTGHLRVSKGGSISYTIALATQPSDPVRVSISGHEATGLTVDVASLDFTPANWDVPQEVTLTAPGKAASITLTHTATGGNYGGIEAEVVVTVIALDPKARQGWLSRFGRTVSHQVVEGIQGRFAAPPSPPGLHLTVAGEALSSTTPLAENQQVLSKALGFETVTTHQLVEGSSFSFAPSADGAPAQFAIWGQGALASFSGAEDSLSLDGDVSTALLGAEWSAARWLAGAALSHSWGSGDYAEDNTVAGGDISSSILTGIFPYGRYRLTPRLGIWAVAGYGWGDLTLKPDGDDADYSPGTTMTMGAVGVDGLLLDGGAEGLSLTTTADALLVQTTSEAVAGLASSDANISRLRLGLEATRPVPLANGASLLPSLELGIRQDRGDAETGFGMELGAGLVWTDSGHGISAALKGRTLLTHTEEAFREQSLAVSFAWEPNPSNRGPSFSVSHAVGAAAEGGMDALLSPTAMETLDVTPSRHHQFETKLAYGFPAFNDRLTLTPGLGWALSPDSRTYSLLWALAPYTQQPQAEPWEISLEGERQEDNAGESAAEHSLKLRFSLPF